ncbi:MAG: hypothetical protein IJ274_14920 [Lachnospiraceae bacterium]|nr:hypothetical protein [Lachnospiraceae bacterium]
MEIGSVLELEEWSLYEIVKQKKKFWLPFMGDNEKYETIFYQSGRNAIEDLLAYLKKERNITKILLPDYMCETVKAAAIRAGISLEYYKVDSYFSYLPDEIEEKLSKETCLFVAHYFGKKPDEEVLKSIQKWKKNGTIIIEDVTLSLFSSDNDGKVGFGTYVLGSIRKWLPIPDGGFLASYTEKLPPQLCSTHVSKYTDFYFMVQAMKREYVKGGCVNKALKKIYMDYYGLSIRELFSDYKLYPMSEWTTNYLQNYDICEVIKKRKQNYDYLYEKIESIEGLTCKIKREEGYLPLGMVIETRNRDQLLQYLIEKGIYCNVHWRLEPSENNPDSNQLTKGCMTIPCDQRYGKQEMNYIVEALEEWYKK